MPRTRAQGTTLTVRKISPAIKSKLRLRAAHHGHSMEAEVRAILEEAMQASPGREPGGAGTRMQQLFAKFGGLELKIPPRGGHRPLPEFE